MGPWAHGPMGPRSRKLKITKRTSALEKIQRAFRSTRIDRSRQVITTEAMFVHGKIHFWPQNEEKGQKGLQITKNPIPPLTGISRCWAYCTNYSSVSVLHQKATIHTRGIAGCFPRDIPIFTLLVICIFEYCSKTAPERPSKYDNKLHLDNEWC